MRCEICGESIGNSESERFGPEFAHKTCVIAFKHGQIDGQETEREACARLCAHLYSVCVPYGSEVRAADADDCACAIRERSNVSIQATAEHLSSATAFTARAAALDLGR